MNGSIDNFRALERFRELLDGARRVVFFTGAGISTESGIPDFRSPGGFWTENKPIDFGDFLASEDVRRESWRRKFNLDDTISQAAPNAGHRAIAALVDSGKASSVITQNIDGLHQLSGVPEDQVIELHGNGTYAHCLDCGKRHELAAIRATFEVDAAPPHCGQCGGIVKTATISFGQAMPQDAMRRAEMEALACDVFVAVGSSLVVYPAAAFPAMARGAGARLVILNREPTEQDAIADLVLHREIGDTLAGVVG